jgi:hypothetical protein
MRFTREQWFTMPLELRQRWWRETRYGAAPSAASADLLAAVRAHLGAAARQANRLQQLATAINATGDSLAARAAAVGLGRSTVWTLLNPQHEGYGPSARLVRIILRKRDLDPRVRAALIDYARDAAEGAFFGYSRRRLARWQRVFE